jgi:anion-transporting  ArsA/GET3 family ATPase
MRSPLDSELLFVTGKGGVGKTTVAAALGVLAAERGRRAIVAEVGEQARLARLFAREPREPGSETRLREGLWSITVDPDQALLEWLQRLGGRVSGRLLAGSSTFQYFAAAAPGAREIVSMVKLYELARTGSYDVVIVDAPATGHALGLLGSPRTFGAIARVGPVAAQAERLGELLRDELRSSYVGVALPTEMAVTEALELQDGLHAALGRSLTAMVVNQVLPQRFEAAELARLDALADGAGKGTDAAELAQSAAAAARAVHRRARFQHNQLARLRRREFAVTALPFLWAAAVELPEVQRLAARLERGF